MLYEIKEMEKIAKLNSCEKKKKEKNKGKKKQSQVRLSRSGCERSPIHRCYPTTVWRGSFCLLCFHPGPGCYSLTNLENSDSSVFPILTPNLARTPDLHRTNRPQKPQPQAVHRPQPPSNWITGVRHYARLMISCKNLNVFCVEPRSYAGTGSIAVLQTC